MNKNKPTTEDSEKLLTENAIKDDLESMESNKPTVIPVETAIQVNGIIIDIGMVTNIVQVRKSDKDNVLGCDCVVFLDARTQIPKAVVPKDKIEAVIYSN